MFQNTDRPDQRTTKAIGNTNKHLNCGKCVIRGPPHEFTVNTVNHSFNFFLVIFYWSIVDLQCYISSSV